MFVQGRELFSIPEVDAYMSKFEAKLSESNNKINQLRTDIERCVAEIDVCMEINILTDTATSKKDLNNVSAKKLNLESQLETEIAKVVKIKEIMAKGIEGLMRDADKQLRADMAKYEETVEKEVYRQLGQLREQQVELLLTLQVAHSEIVMKLFNYDEVVNLFELRGKKNPSNQMFHNNLYMSHRSHPEFGSPFINCGNLQAVEDRIMREHAETNSLANGHLPANKRIEIPQPKRLKDINLQRFIDSL